MDVWSITRVIPSITVEQGRRRRIGIVPAVRRHGARHRQRGRLLHRRHGRLEPRAAGASPRCISIRMRSKSNFLAGNNPAESPRGGLVFNMVTKTGTNQFHGGGMFSGTNQGLGFDNFSGDAGSRSAPQRAAVGAARPDLKPGADINYIWDTASGSPARSSRTSCGSPRRITIRSCCSISWAATTPTARRRPTTTSLQPPTSVVADQPDQPALALLHAAAQGERPSRRHQAVRRHGANNNNKYPPVHQVKWTNSRSSRLLFDVSTSVHRVDDYQPWPRKAIRRPARRHIARSFRRADCRHQLGRYAAAHPAHLQQQSEPRVFIGSVSYFTTTHDIKAGYSMNYAKRTGNVYSTSDMRAVYRNGIPDSSTRTTRRSAR